MFQTAALVFATLLAAPAEAQNTRSLIVVEPSGTRAELLIENRTGRIVELFMDGYRVDSLSPGPRVLQVVGGRHQLEARVGGRVISRWTADARPYERARWSIDPPRVAELRIKNPLPMAVVVEAGAFSRTIPAYGELLLTQMPVGWVDLRVRRVSGQAFDGARLVMDPWEPTKVILTPPTRGLVVVDNDQARPLSLYANGRYVGQVLPGRESSFELPLGDARLDLVDESGRYAQTLQSLRLRVDPFEPERIEVRGAGCSMDDHRGHGGHDHDHGNDGYSDYGGYGGYSGYTGYTGAETRESPDRDDRRYVEAAEQNDRPLALPQTSR